MGRMKELWQELQELEEPMNDEKDKLKIKLHDLGDCTYTLELRTKVTANSTFVNLTQDQLADLAVYLNDHLDKDVQCGDVCDFN